MAISDIYTGSNTVTSSAAGPTYLVSMYGGATKRAWVVGVRVECTATSASAGNSALWVLGRNTTTNTPTGNTTGAPHDFSAAASLGSTAVTWSTTPVASTILADWTIPQTVGSAWEEFPPLGYEWGVTALASGANAGVSLLLTQAASSSTYVTQIIWSE